jgi:hypothetical protein
VANCGACGKVCSDPQHGAPACTNGQCGVICDVGFSACSGQCVSLASDAKNCGGCGKACANNQVCSGGACVVSCPPGKTNCGGNCADTTSDTANCGACGKVCSAPANATPSCANSACAFVCNVGFTACNGACVDTTSDVANCGGCGKACPGPAFGAGTAVCSAGACGLACGNGLTSCNGACVNTAVDAQNCGGCGAALAKGQNPNPHNCAGGKSCVGGACVAACEPQTATCGNACVDKRSDPKNCGACGNSCGINECSQGVCVSPAMICANGQTRCTGANGLWCADLQSDPANCGSCGTDCGAARLCVAGTCTAFLYASAMGECGGATPTYCNDAATSSLGVCVAGKACP